MTRRLAFLTFAGLLALAACSDESANAPWIEIRGGGFLFNYRIAEVTATVVAAPLRVLPAGGMVEATFTDPAGGAPIVLKQPVGEKRLTYDFTTPPLFGVETGKAYPVTVRLVAADGKELQKLEKPFKSDLDQSILPPKPLTIGPGYTPNPALETPPPALP